MPAKPSTGWPSAAKEPSTLQVSDYVVDEPAKPAGSGKPETSKSAPAASALLQLYNDGDARPQSVSPAGDISLDPSQAPLPAKGHSLKDEAPHAVDPAPVFYNGVEDGVEEAVLRYVGQELRDEPRDGRGKKRKQHPTPASSAGHISNGNYDTDFSEYIGNGSWAKYLSEDITGGDDDHHHDHHDGHHHHHGHAHEGHHDHHDAHDGHSHDDGHDHRTDYHLMFDGQAAGSVMPPPRRTTSGSPTGKPPAKKPHLQEPEHASSALRQTLHPDTADQRPAWTGDGSEMGGSFDETEIKALDDFMMDYCRQHQLDRKSLCERVWASERKKDNFWDAVAAVLPHRTRASVYKHVRRAYHVFTVRGKWSPSEDLQLGQLFNEKGAQWKAIGMIIHRMPEDCRDRWRNYVKCGEGRNQNKWTPKEEDVLRKIVTADLAAAPRQPINWTLVSERMGGRRSRIQCRYKWKKISKHHKLEE